MTFRVACLCFLFFREGDGDDDDDAVCCGFWVTANWLGSRQLSPSETGWAEMSVWTEGREIGSSLLCPGQLIFCSPCR